MLPKFLRVPERRRLSIKLKSPFAQLIFAQLKLLLALGDFLQAGGRIEVVQQRFRRRIISPLVGLLAQLLDLLLKLILALLKGKLSLLEPQTRRPQIRFKL